MSSRPDGAVAWNTGERRLVTFARNVLTRYAALLVNAVIGLVMLPINLRYLGSADYGLWTLIASITTYFTALQLGYGSAVVRFIAEFRQKRDLRALNEILSTMFYLFSGIGAVAYLLAIVVAIFLPNLFNLAPEQVGVGRFVLLAAAVNVALYFPFSIFGGVMNGFERYYINNIVSTISSISVAIVNVLMLWMGYGLVALVAATTLARIVPFFFYRWNAYKIFPLMEIRRSLVRRQRLRDVTGFSVYLAVIDWSARLSYTTDLFILGAFFNTTVVAVYSIGLKLSEQLVTMANQLHNFLFPAVVQRAVAGAEGAQRELLIKASRFQLAIAVALCGSVIAVADTLISAWVGPGYEGSVLIARLLAFVVILRTWMAVPSTVLKGSGHHRSLAISAAWSTVANLLLSVLLVTWMGMVGVAIGTLVPALVLAGVVVFPQACRSVGLRVVDGYREVVWPAIWPALVVVAILTATREFVPHRILGVLAHLAFGGLIYALLFVTLGLGREERQWCTAAISAVLRRSSRGLAPV